MKLLADPLKIGVLIGNQGFEHRRKQTIVFLERLQNRAGRQIELGQTAAVVLHLLDELERRMSQGQNSRSGSGGDGGQRDALFGLELKLPQTVEKTAIDFIGQRIEQNGEALEVDAKLIAENVGGIGELRRDLGSLHCLSIGQLGGFL